MGIVLTTTWRTILESSEKIQIFDFVGVDTWSGIFNYFNYWFTSTNKPTNVFFLQWFAAFSVLVTTWTLFFGWRRAGNQISNTKTTKRIKSNVHIIYSLGPFGCLGFVKSEKFLQQMWGSSFFHQSPLTVWKLQFKTFASRPASYCWSETPV